MLLIDIPVRGPTTTRRPSNVCTLFDVPLPGTTEKDKDMSTRLEDIRDWKEAAKIPRSLPLDGMRGIAVFVLLLYHFGFEWIQGAWIGINMFFFFSGYVIVMLLLKEYARTGKVPIMEFYRRRLRRLLPALFILVATWGIFLAPDEVRRPLKGDILATLGFFQNWRLISQSDQYFAQFGNPSFFRHVWTLSIEEQFYVFVPFLVIALMLWVPSRTVRVTIVFAMVCFSAWRMSVVGLDSAGAMAHAYYGTDTRVQALLVGVMAAFVFGPDGHGRRPKPWPYPAVFIGGWGGLLVTIYALVSIPLFTPFMFERGGLLALTLLLILGIPAAVDKRQTVFVRLFSFPPFVYLGTLVYGLYLWHWPIMLWLKMYWPDLGGIWLPIVGCVLTFIPAALSFHFVEMRVLFSGLQSFTGTLGKARILTAGSFAVLIAAAFVVADVPTVEDQIAKGDIPTLVQGTPEYEPGEPPLRVGLYGDSVPQRLVENFPGSVYSDLDVVGFTAEGCSVIVLPMRISERESRPEEERCIAFRSTFPEKIAQDPVDVLVLQTGSMLGFEFWLDDRPVSIKDEEFREVVAKELDDRLLAAEAAGVKSVQLVTVPCRDQGVDLLSLAQDVSPNSAQYLKAHPEVTARLADPREVNEFLKDWAAKNDVVVLDIYGALRCEEGFVPRINDIDLFEDNYHFSTTSSAMVWTWLAPEIAGNARKGSTK